MRFLNKIFNLSQELKALVKLFQSETKTEFPNSGEDDLSAEKTRVRPKKKLKPNPDSDDESPERKPLGLLSNLTRAPIIGILLIVVLSWEVKSLIGLVLDKLIHTRFVFFINWYIYFRLFLWRLSLDF